MSPRYSLPPAVYLALSQSVADAVNCVLAGEKGAYFASARRFSHLTSAIDDCLRAALIAANRTYNALFSPQARLPPEVWALVWELLPVKDCISVSHVCHSWRQNAVSCPRLWRVLDIVSHVCVCQECLHTQESRAFQRACDCLPAQYPPTNIPFLGTLLQRGLRMPFALDLRIILPDDSDDHLLDPELTVQVATTLASHASRMREARISIPSPRALSNLLNQLVAVPALVAIELICVPNATQRSDFWPTGKSLALHRLGSLKLSKDLQWPAHGLRLDSLRELECTFNSEGELRRILTSCPNIVSWTIRAPFHHVAATQEWHPFVLDEISNEAQRISTMKLLEVDSNHLDVLLSLFGEASRMEFGLSFETIRQPVHIERSLQLLRHCPTVITITTSHADGWTKLALAEIGGRIRSLAYPYPPDSVLPLVWPSLAPTATIIGILSCLTCWPLFCKPQPTLWTLLELHVFIDQPLEALTPVSLGLPQGACLLSLHTVTIMVKSPAITIPVAWLCSLVQSLRLCRVLPKLVVSNASIVGPLELLRGLVFYVSDVSARQY